VPATLDYCYLLEKVRKEEKPPPLASPRFFAYVMNEKSRSFFFGDHEINPSWGM